jgi:hypothetical protein
MTKCENLLTKSSNFSFKEVSSSAQFNREIVRQLVFKDWQNSCFKKIERKAVVLCYTTNPPLF